MSQIQPTVSELFVQNSGEMGRLIQETDWSKTPLGPISSWSPTLKTITRFLLANRFPLLLWWGPQFIQIYNDAYRPILGTKHPQYLGRPTSECWSEIWHILKPLIETPFRGGTATWMEDIQLEINRYGFLEESHFTIAYSAVPDDTVEGGIGGVLATVHEISEKVVAERRILVLRDLGASGAEAKSGEEACALAAEVLAKHEKDVPFALLYLIDADRKHARLAGATGVNSGTAISPLEINLISDPVWDFSTVLRTQNPHKIEDLSSRFGSAVPQGPWSDRPQQAIVAPIRSSTPNQPAGFLVFGISARLQFDESYRNFLELTTSQIATAIANARAYEDEKRRAEALAELDRTKTTFFSNVSHEFRTPLTLMLGPLEDSLAEDLSSLTRGRLEVAHRHSLRLLKLVNNLLDFSRIEAGRIRATYEPVNLSALTSDLASVFRSAIETAGLTLKIDCPPLQEPVYVDREMWEKIVLNLISNAFKFTFDGQIEVSLHSRGPSVELIVRDTGTGVAEQELPRIFERFHRIENARGRTYEGSGIGLSLVQELVKLHGGTIVVQSELNKGTAFIITIPFGHAHLPGDHLVAATLVTSGGTQANAFVEEALRWLPNASPITKVEDPVSVVSSIDRSANRKQILLADDNADMREYLQRLLSSKYEVLSVSDGEAALDSAQRLIPGLILTDVMMPKLDGFALLKALRSDSRTATIPVILLSARAGEEARIEGMQAGADDYLVKPFSARELLARVEGALKLHEERTRVLDASRQASRVKDEFLATVSHELRTPLNAILGWAHMLQSRTLDPAVAGSAVSAIYESAKAQAQLIGDLLDVGRITSGKMNLEPQKIVLDDVLSRAVSTVGHAIRAKNLQLHLEYSRGSHTTTLYADPQRLQQIFWNLLSNAVKFTPDGGTIEIVVVRTKSEAIIAVRDSGIGIPEEFLPFVFERFRQWDSSTSRKFGGLGLGMSIAKNLVELHGGTISVHSEGSGMGTTFRIVLPLFKPEKDEQPLLAMSLHNEPAYDIKLPGTRILLVDDDLQTLHLMREAFEHCGAETRTSESASGAYEILKNWIPDLLISDIAMPDHDGYWLIHEVRSFPQLANISAIGLTAYSTAADRANVLAAGFNMFVAKPIEPAELLNTSKTLLEHNFAKSNSTVQATLPQKQITSELAGKKILLIEDDLLSVEVLRIALEREGSDFRSADRASQALDTVQNWLPDVIISDIGLPDEDGNTLIKKIHSLTAFAGPPIPAIALTGYGQQEGERALASGFQVYKSKPIEPATLISLLKDIICNRIPRRL